MPGRLAVLEDRIARGFAEVGECLREIRDGKLFREAGYHSFRTYCRDRWEMDHKQAHRLIQSANIIQLLSPNHDTLPQREGHARALTGLADNPELLDQVWTEAVKTAPESGITEKHIRETRRRLTEPIRLDPDTMMNDSCMNTNVVVRQTVLDLVEQIIQKEPSPAELQLIRERLFGVNGAA